VRAEGSAREREINTKERERERGRAREREKGRARGTVRVDEVLLKALLEVVQDGRLVAVVFQQHKVLHTDRVAFQVGLPQRAGAGAAYHLVGWRERER
jgi:hypothetical protein